VVVGEEIDGPTVTRSSAWRCLKRRLVARFLEVVDQPPTNSSVGGTKRSELSGSDYEQ
jgi:hypothetical protein